MTYRIDNTLDEILACTGGGHEDTDSFSGAFIQKTA